MARLIGQQLGNYRLIRLLGMGGYAEVYLGEHIHLKRQAAIKVLRTVLKDEQKADFVMEAQRMVDLSHSSIIPVFDFAIEGDFPYLIMEYAPNGTLRTRHPAGLCLPLETVVSYVKCIAAPLQYLHDQKLIHRDIKPENLLVGKHQEILLSDFGIAAIAHRTSSLNMQELAGTPQYMAPEQARGMPRAASDQYSLGIVAYEWLCGTVPFQGSVIGLAVQHLSSPPPSLRQHVPTLPPAVEQVILKALAKEPQQRFRTITEFAVALEAASQPTQAVPVLSPRERDQVPSDISRVPTVLLAEPVQHPYLLGGEVVSLRDTQPLAQFPEHVGRIQDRAPIKKKVMSRPVAGRNASSVSHSPKNYTTLAPVASPLVPQATALWKRNGLSYILRVLPLIFVLILTSSMLGFVYYFTSHAQTPTPQPTQQNVLATDTFHRPDQHGWGTTSNGLPWSIDATAQPYFSINNSTGIIAGGQEPLEALIGQPTANVEVTMTGSVNQFGNANRSGDKVYLGIVLRWTDANNWYAAYIDGNQLVIVKSVKGYQTIIGQKAVSTSAGVGQVLRFAAYGTTLSAKVWSSNDNVPADWQVGVDDHAFTTGQFGMRVFEQSTTVIRIAQFNVLKATAENDT